MALTEEEQLYNLALGLIGESEVTEGQTGTKQYELCSRFYSVARDEVLQLHLWNEAEKQVTIMQETTIPLFDYDYKYALPSDCLRIVSIGSDLYEWKVQGEYIVTDFSRTPSNYNSGGIYYEAGQYLSYSSVTYLVDTAFTSSAWTTDSSYVTSQGDDYKVIDVTYIYQLTDITKFSVKLKNAIAHKLASKIVVAITNNPKAKDYLIEEFEKLVMPQARSVDAMQGTLRPFYNSKWIRSRY